MNNTNTIKAFSYAHKNITQEVLDLQRQVFTKLNLQIEQIVDDKSHGDFLNHILKTCTCDYVIFFDVDCIPLTEDIYDIIITELQREKCIIGIEQMCNCNPHNHVYAGPGCLALERKLYFELNSPDLKENGNKSDVGEELTWACEEKGVKVKIFNAASSELPMWDLPDNRKFGIGTTYTYNNKEVLYHQFSIRMQNKNFINKCKEFLKT